RRRAALRGAFRLDARSRWAGVNDRQTPDDGSRDCLQRGAIPSGVLSLPRAAGSGRQPHHAALSRPTGRDRRSTARCRGHAHQQRAGRHRSPHPHPRRAPSAGDVRGGNPRGQPQHGPATRHRLLAPHQRQFSLHRTEPAGGIVRLRAVRARTLVAAKVRDQLAETTGSARSLAKPRVATVEGLEAKINSTQTIPLVIKGENNTQTIQNITTGINLRMLPRVTPEQTVETQLSIAVSSPTGTTPSGVPQYSTREANTTVRVRNAETIVIGGLIESRRAVAASGIPGLMDLPVVGDVFRTTTTQEVDTDLIIVVTPYIVGSASTAPAPGTPPPPAAPSGGQTP
ncbi:MAG: type II and III secretion system protein, partial [Pleurocapsa sp. SU_196_0]|nr:type II and III secretion system protein [Pleurocapsa sp. SU_196_0]